MEAGFVEPLGEVNETKKEIIITLDLQGAHEDSLLISVKEDYVIVEAEKGHVAPQEGKGIHIKSVPHDYRLMLDLPKAVEPASIKRTFHNGVLEIRLDKAKK